MPTNRALTLPAPDAEKIRRAWLTNKNIDAQEEMRVVLCALSINARKALTSATTEQVIEAVLRALPWHTSIAGRAWLKKNPAMAAKLRAAIAKAQADLRQADNATPVSNGAEGNARFQQREAPRA